MLRPATFLAMIGTLATSAQAGFGASWWLTGDAATHGKSFITRAVTTLQVPEAPHPQVDRIALWPGMETTNKGLVQSIIVSFGDPSKPAPAGCGGKAGQWCAFASLYDGGSQKSGKYVPVNPGDMLKIDYQYHADSGAITQTVSRGGKTLSTFKSTTGKAYYWDATVECEAKANGKMPAYSYHNTEITLNKANQGFGGTLQKASSSDSGLHSPDGGKTWKVDTIHIDAAPCHPNS